VYTPIDHLARGPWGAGIAWQACRAMKACGGERGACQRIPNSQDHFYD